VAAASAPIVLAAVAGAPSAIVPLTESLRSFPLPRHSRPRAGDRGARSAVEEALQKTRLHPSPWFEPTRPAPKAAVLPAPATPTPSISVPARLALSAAERRPSKARCEQFPVAHPSPARAKTPSTGPRVAPLLRLASKTRLLAVPSLIGPSASSPSPRPSVAPPPSRPAPRAASLAARRTGPGAPFRYDPSGQRTAARSARTLPAARRFGTLLARPVARGASSRP
jgi:hypothetical protein